MDQTPWNVAVNTHKDTTPQSAGSSLRERELHPNSQKTVHKQQCAGSRLEPLRPHWAAHRDMACEENGGGLWICKHKQWAFLWDTRSSRRGSLSPPADLAHYGGARPSSPHLCYLDPAFLSGWWSGYVLFVSFTTPHHYPPVTINCVFLPRGVLLVIAAILTAA